MVHDSTALGHCLTCAWKGLVDESEKIDASVDFECHRFPPVLLGTGEPEVFTSGFPAVSAFGWCGEWTDEDGLHTDYEDQAR